MKSYREHLLLAVIDEFLTSRVARELHEVVPHHLGGGLEVPVAVVVDGNYLDEGHAVLAQHTGFHGDAFIGLDGLAVLQLDAEGGVLREVGLHGYLHAVHGLVGAPGVEEGVFLPVVLIDIRHNGVGGARCREIRHLYRAALL